MKGVEGHLPPPLLLAVGKSIHIDMDAFYASVSSATIGARGKPVAVGYPRRAACRGASYELAKFGVHSAIRR